MVGAKSRAVAPPLVTAPRAAERSLDPEDWDGFRRLSHAALDDMIDFVASVRERPLWTEPPVAVRSRLNEELPRAPTGLGEVLETFDEIIKPYATGNLHPGFVGWVHGAGTPVGMLAEMLAAGLNANCGGRNHIGIEVERQIARWMRDLFGFPATASGLFVTGTSIANFLALLVARHASLGDGVRPGGLPADHTLCAYASAAAHGCIAQAMEMAGLGSARLRRIACDAEGAMDVDALAGALDMDKGHGLRPFLVVGTAGTVDIGAVDPLRDIAALARSNGAWFHVDGAFGALAALSPRLRPMLDGIEDADSIAFDFHKWLHVPYDAGFLLIRDEAAHRRAFAAHNGYLTRAQTGLAAGGTWPCDLGPDLSRGFRALKTWFTLKVFGTDRLGEAIERSCRLASRLAARLRGCGEVQVVAPVRLNIVCVSAAGPDADRINRAVVERLHSQGAFAPSITLLGGMAVVRCAINNHRTTEADVDALAAHLVAAFATERGEAASPRNRLAPCAG